MKILFKIISAFLYFTFVSPVQMYYIYDETPNVGFVSVDNGVGTYMKTGYSVGKPSKKQVTATYSNPKFQKINNEHVVDSHFKIRKTPSKPYSIPALEDNGKIITYATNEGKKSKAQKIVEEYRNTEAPQQLQHSSQHQSMVNTAGQQDEQNNRGDYGVKLKEAASYSQSPNNKQVPPIRPKAVNADYSKSMRQRNQDVGNGQNNLGAERGQKNQGVERGQRNQGAERAQRNQEADRGQRNQGAERAQRNQGAERGQRNQDLGRSQRNQDLERVQRNQDIGRSQRQNDAGISQIVRQDNGYDSKTTFMNVRKAPISVDPQTLILNSNHQLTSLSVISSDKRQRMPTSMMMDKTLHKASGIANDHHKQVMARVLDDMTKTLTDRRHTKGEYVNKNIEDHLDTIYEKSKRSVIAENLRKYIGKEKIGKDLRNQHKQITALARIGSHEESLEDDTPYAVFYRMNPESLDRQDGFMIPRSMDDNGSSDFSSKEKRPHTAFQEDTENMTGIQHSNKNAGSTLLRKKIKNFSSYMNY